MARDIDVEVSGVELTRAALALLEFEATRQLDDIGSDAAESVASRVRLLMPMGPQAGGHARSSVEVDHPPGLRATVREGGGELTLDDLASYRVVWRRPVRVRFRGHEFVSNPPPSS